MLTALDYFIFFNSLILVVLCPLSIVENWANEFKMFAPSIKVLKYIGGKQEREDKREEIVNFIKKQPKAQWKDPHLPFDVFITNYEMLMNDIDFMHKFKFRLVIVDEGKLHTSTQISNFIIYI